MQIKIKAYKYREVVLMPGAVYDIEDEAFCARLIAEGAAEEVRPEPAEAAMELEDRIQM